MVAVLSPDVLPQIRMTVDEYLVADLPEGHRYELVEGVVLVSPTPGINHDVIIARLHRVFVAYAERQPDAVAHVSQRAGVAIVSRQTVREPDFAIYAPGQIEAGKGKTWKDVEPILVVEVVSPGQAERDYEEKRRDYWDAGVREYWIADGKRGGITMLSRGAADWDQSFFGAEQTFRSARFPDLEIDLDAIFKTD